jgi:hypothetical protein
VAADGEQRRSRRFGDQCRGGSAADGRLDQLDVREPGPPDVQVLGQPRLLDLVGLLPLMRRRGLDVELETQPGANRRHTDATQIRLLEREAHRRLGLS